MADSRITDEFGPLLVHKNGRHEHYESIASPETDEHHIVRHQADGIGHLSCSCGAWETKDGCGCCLNTAFVAHIEATVSGSPAQGGQP